MTTPPLGLGDSQESSCVNEKDGIREHQGDAVDHENIHLDRPVQGSSSPTALGLALILVPTTLCSVLVFLDSAIIVTAIPAITQDFGSIVDIGWYSSVYLFCNCSVQPLLGRFFGQLPLRYTFFAFFAGFEVGSLVCALANSSGMMIAGRALAGVGGAGVLNGALAIVSASVPLGRRPLFLSVLLGFGQLGTAFGPLIGGALTQAITWRWNFYLNLPIGGFALIVLLLAPIPKYSERSSSESLTASSKVKATISLDWLGFVLFASSVVMVLLPLQWGTDNVKPWNSSVVIGLFVGSGSTAIIFVIWQWFRGDDALLPLSIISRTVVWSSCLMCFFQMGNMVITLYYLPLYFQVAQGKSPVLSGLYLLPMIGAQIFITVLTGALAGIFGHYALYGLINGVLVAIGAGLMTTFKPGMSAGLWVGSEILVGVGRGCGLQMPFIAIQAALRPADAAVGTSLAIFGQYFGGAVFSGIAEAILVSSLSKSAREYGSGIDPKAITAAAALPSSVPQSLMAAYVNAYNKAITLVFWLIVATAVAMIFSSPGMGWKKRNPPDETAH